RRISLGALLAGSLTTGVSSAEPSAAGAAKTEPLPYGHKDFVPTPEKPIYFRAGNGEYPGATPPTEWWEGTPTTKKVRGIFGNPAQHKEAEVQDFADDKSKNILWKVPVPGWGLSHPIVVGKKVFTVGEPDFVTCYDFDSGKKLWERRVNPLLLDGMPTEKALAGQKVLDLARAFFYIGTKFSACGMQPDNLFNSGWDRDDKPKTDDPAAFVAQKKAMATRLLAAFTPRRAEVVAFEDTALLAALDKDLAILQRFAAVADLESLKALKKENLRPVNLLRACASVLNVGIGGAWWGYVGSADSTLASDGKHIYGVFDQGQYFCYDLDGNLVWGHREKGEYDNRSTFHRSPLLCGDLLLVRGHKGGRFGSMFPILALDTKTGQVRWETSVRAPNYTVPRLMRLQGSNGKPMDVLIGEAAEDKAKDLGLPILRVNDGKIIGHTPWQDCGRGALMGINGDLVTWTSTSDTGGGPSCCYRLKAVGADAVSAEEIYVLGKDDRRARPFYNQAGFPTMLGSLWVYGNTIFDTTNARKVSAVSAERFQDYDGMVIAGRYLIGSPGDSTWSGRNRDDHKAMAKFVVVDLSDPANPKVVAKNNLLGYADPPADIIVSTYFKGFDPISFAGCYL
ncbi:MAG: PQQ-binding-like beta-propeller repeat protein, partial [bacterium]